jgi:hypothetical protein
MCTWFIVTCLNVCIGIVLHVTWIPAYCALLYALFCTSVFRADEKKLVRALEIAASSRHAKTRTHARTYAHTHARVRLLGKNVRSRYCCACMPAFLCRME